MPDSRAYAVKEGGGCQIGRAYAVKEGGGCR